MKFGAVYCLYDDHEYLRESIDAVANQLDKILFLMSDVPWHGRSCDNTNTRSAVRLLCERYPQCELIEGHWENEIEQRNFGLDRFLQWGIDIYFIIDSDEVYREDHFSRIRQFIMALPNVAAFHLEWNTYWKKDYFRIDPREEYKPLVAVRANQFNFTIIRGGTTAVSRSMKGITPCGEGYSAVLIPPEVGICYHLSYARSDDYMRRKLETNSHAPDFIPNWYHDVWEKWTPLAENLHPIKPTQYRRAVRESLSNFPKSLQSYIKHERLPRRETLVVLMGDDTVEWSQAIHAISSQANHLHEIAIATQLPPRGCGNIVWVEAVRSIAGLIGNRDLCLMDATQLFGPNWLSVMYDELMQQPAAGVVANVGSSEGLNKSLLIIREVLDDIGFPRALNDSIYLSEASRHYSICVKSG